MTQHKVVSHEEWTEARKALLAREKEFSRQREALARQRRDLPWEEVTKDYVFDGPDGKLTLPDLFDGSSQLVVYHFMFPPEWDAGCPHCSFWADNFDGTPVHLRARDVSFAAVSRAPIGQIAAYQQRMGWSFPWVSSGRDGLQLRLRRLVHARGRSPATRPSTTTGPTRRRGPRGDQRLRQGRAGPRLPHVLDLRARHRHGERRLPVPGPRAQGPRRTRRRRPAVLGPPPRRVRFLIPRIGVRILTPGEPLVLGLL